MRIAYVCFITAAAAGLGGMGLGIFMGLAHDFTLAAVHAHVNLLGWVTLSLYGLYHRGIVRADNRLAWTQVGSAVLGFVMLTSGMAFLIGADLQAFLPVAIIGAMLSLVSMGLYIGILLHDASRTAAMPDPGPGDRVLGW